MNTVYISVGTNIGNKVSNCRLAIKKLYQFQIHVKYHLFTKHLRGDMKMIFL